MKIREVYIKNFRSIKEERLYFSPTMLIALIGANNAGKSNFLRAIDLVLGDGYSTENKLEDYDFYCGNRENEIEIKISFSGNQERIDYICFKKYAGEYRLLVKSLDRENEVFLSNNIRDKFPCIYLSAERSISKDMNFSKWSLMGKISKSFNKSLSEEQKDELNNHFAEVKNVFNSVENYKGFEEDFKSFFDDMQSDSPYKLEVDFKPFSPINYFKNINILAKDPNVDENIDIEELGDGAKNLAVISLLRSYAKNFRDANGILAIEEPEIYLHPQARRHLFDILKDLSNSGFQVIYTTHDPNFLDIGEFESIRRISKKIDAENNLKKHSVINQISYGKLGEFIKDTGGPEGLERDSVKNFYKSVSNYRLTEGFFSNLIILCEGPTEELVIPKYFEAQGFKYNSFGISVIGAIGKSQIAKYWRLFNRFGIPVICLFDNDNSDSSKEKNNQILCDCFGKQITDFTTGLNNDYYKEIEIENGKLVILEKDIENVIEKDFMKSGTEEDYISIKTLIEKAPKQICCLNLVSSILDTYGYIPKFIEAIKDKALYDTPF